MEHQYGISQIMRGCTRCGSELPLTASPKRMYCNSCKAEVIRQREVVRNRKRRGDMPTVVLCARCGIDFDRGNTPGPSKRYCEACKEVRRRQHFTEMNHRKRGKPETEFTCDDCHKSFPRTSKTKPKRCRDCRIAHDAVLRKRIYDADPEKFRKRSRDAFARLQGDEREAYLARAREKGKKRYEANPEEGRLRAIKAKYGLPIDDYLRMIEDTGSACPVCTSTFTSKGKHKRCVDHDHTSGTIRGIICMMCNFAIGQFDDDADNVERAIAYLRSHHEDL